MLILLTRPWNQALRSAERLAAIGHTAILSPVLEIRRTGAAWPQGVFDAALATSARAFECLDLAPEWPPPELRRMLPLFVVGATTGEAARAAGFGTSGMPSASAKKARARGSPPGGIANCT